MAELYKKHNRLKKIILFATILFFIVIILILCIYISNLKEYKKVSEYKIVDSCNISYKVSYYKNYRDDGCFSIDNSPRIYYGNRPPEKVVRLVFEDENVLYWIYYNQNFEILLYTDGTHYETFELTEEYDSTSTSEKCLSFLRILADQKIMDSYTEIENKSYWYTRISAVIN